MTAITPAFVQHFGALSPFELQHTVEELLHEEEEMNYAISDLSTAYRTHKFLAHKINSKAVSLVEPTDLQSLWNTQKRYQKLMSQLDRIQDVSPSITLNRARPYTHTILGTVLHPSYPHNIFITGFFLNNRTAAIRISSNERVLADIQIVRLFADHIDEGEKEEKDYRGQIPPLESSLVVRQFINRSEDTLIAHLMAHILCEIHSRESEKIIRTMADAPLVDSLTEKGFAVRTDLRIDNKYYLFKVAKQASTNFLKGNGPVLNRYFYRDLNPVTP